MMYILKLKFDEEKKEDKYIWKFPVKTLCFHFN